MHKENFKKKDLIKHVSLNTGFSFNFSKKLVEDLIEIISENIKKDNFNLKNIGSFKILHKKERLGRNPKTNQKFTITARKSVSFKISKKINNKINKIYE